ncbi:NXPE family member 3-like [Physella acuta]|uniref:NXPE family member 3-like n=1 Tax=Physella acuta TaxID=109671 RepID=UPI0027DB2509|nr:NXPE family member 3-like [Physella acuta]
MEVRMIFTKRKKFMFIIGLSILSYVVYFKISSTPNYLPFEGTTKSPQRKRIPSLQHNDSDVHFSLATKEEFWDDGPIDIYEAFAQHSYKTLETCNNTCHAVETVCKANTIKLLDKINLDDIVEKKPFLARGQYVFEWEKKYLSYPPLNDIKTLPDLKLSKVTVENTRQGVVRCKILETIHGRLDVVDGYGRQRTKGDDVVRVWMKGGNNSDHAVVGNVTDLQNGSYTFTVKCLWAGISKLSVAISYPREFLRIAIHQIYIGRSWYMTGTFEKSSIKESTFCFHTPNLPGWECICNFSTFGYENYYCGRPRDPRLTCDDWVSGDSATVPQPHDVTDAERHLVKNICSKPVEKTVTHNFTVITENAGKLPDLPLCRQSSRRVTWTQTTPKGFWSPGNVWSSLVCQDPGVVNSSWFLNCMRNTSVWFFGDSNARMPYLNLLEITKCDNVTGGYPLWTSCYLPEYGTSIHLNTHEGPIHIHFPRQEFFTIPKFILTLPKNKKHVLVIHYYLHLIISHLSVLLLRMKSLRIAIEEMLRTNPNVLVGLRGPHVSSWELDHNHAVGGDPLGPQFLEIIREQFRGLEDKVVFLDMWEMSIGIENFDYHPPQYANREMMKFLLSFQC